MVLGDDERRAYAILGVPPSTTSDEVKRAYRALVRKWHPDHYDTDPVSREEATRTMAMINWAYHRIVNTKTDAVGNAMLGSSAVGSIPSPFTRNQVDDIVKAIVSDRSFTSEWSDPWNRVAVWVAMIWVTLVALVSWFGPKTGFDPLVGRAVASVGALSLMMACVGMIWFGNGGYRILGWIFLVFFVLLLPIFRAIMWVTLR